MGLGPTVCKNCLVLMKLDDTHDDWYCPSCQQDYTANNSTHLFYLDIETLKQLDKNCSTNFYEINMRYKKKT